MNPVDPVEIEEGATRVTFAKDQPQYAQLPATVTSDGAVTTEWEPTADELGQLFTGGRVQITMLTFGKPLQPLRVGAIGGQGIT